jgi:hypothetical protein
MCIVCQIRACESEGGLAAGARVTRRCKVWLGLLLDCSHLATLSQTLAHFR